jgi:hypothetical protein
MDFSGFLQLQVTPHTAGLDADDETTMTELFSEFLQSQLQVLFRHL